MVLQRYRQSLRDMYDLLRQPEVILAKKSEASLLGAIKQLLYYSFTGAIIGALPVVLIVTVLGLLAPGVGAGPLAFAIMLGLLLWMILVFLMIVFNLIDLTLVHFIARALGGSGNYTEYIYITSVAQSRLFFVSLAFWWVPVLSNLVALYAIYLITRFTKELHQITLIRAVLAYLATVILFMILLFAWLLL